MSGRSKNHTLKGGTSPYSLSMGVPPPRTLRFTLSTCQPSGITILIRPIDEMHLAEEEEMLLLRKKANKQGNSFSFFPCRIARIQEMLFS